MADVVSSGGNLYGVFGNFECYCYGQKEDDKRYWDQLIPNMFGFRNACRAFQSVKQ